MDTKNWGAVSPGQGFTRRSRKGCPKNFRDPTEEVSTDGVKLLGKTIRLPPMAEVRLRHASRRERPMLSRYPTRCGTPIVRRAAGHRHWGTLPQN